MAHAMPMPAHAGPLRARHGRAMMAPLAAAKPATRPSSKGPKEIVMRPLTPSSSNGVGRAPDQSSVASGSFASVSSYDEGGSSSTRPRNGVVVAQAPLKSYMPVARAAAAELAQSLSEARERDLAPGGTYSTRPVPSGGVAGPRDASPLIVEAEVMDRPSDADFKWAQDSYSALQRTADTWTFFTIFRTRLWLLDQKWSYAGGFSEAKKSERAKGLAKYLLNSILDLGPTFIKIGQLSSTRSDLFPAEFVDELATLQDRVPAFSAAKAIAIIEKDLGRPVDKLFASFDTRPIAAASLGQVHRAVLFTGQEVVVKVQRPGLKQLFDIDLENLRILAEQLDKGDENRDFKGIYQECAQVLYEEIDYLNEGRNADRFRRNFRTDATWARTPVVYWEYCSPRVLVLEYLPGVKISDKERLSAAGLNLDTISQRATEAYLIQILKHGFFHADPHPGNVSVDPRTGDLLFYDFGMMGEIVPDVRTRLLDVFYGVYRKDTDQVLTALIALQVIKPAGDLLSLRRAIGYFVNNLAQQAERQETIAAIGADLFAIAVDQPFRFPATFTFVLRAFSTLEGIGKTLNPDYQFSKVAQPYAAELLQLQDVNGRSGALILSQLQQQAQDLGQAAAAMPIRIQRIEQTLAQLENGDLKLRVRALEGERADRRSGVLQMATINTVASVGLLNVGTMLGLNGATGPATLAMTLSALFGVLLLAGLKRVQRLDKFEKEIRG